MLRRSGNANNVPPRCERSDVATSCGRADGSATAAARPLLKGFRLEVVDGVEVLDACLDEDVLVDALADVVFDEVVFPAMVLVTKLVAMLVLDGFNTSGLLTKDVVVGTVETDVETTLRDI